MTFRKSDQPEEGRNFYVLNFPCKFLPSFSPNGTELTRAIAVYPGVTNGSNSSVRLGGILGRAFAATRMYENFGAGFVGEGREDGTEVE